MLKIAVIGGRDTVMGFKALGLMVRPCHDLGRARRPAHSLTRAIPRKRSVIYLEETA